MEHIDIGGTYTYASRRVCPTKRRSVVSVLAFLIGTATLAQVFIPHRPAGVTYSPLWTQYKNRGQVFHADGHPADAVLTSSVGTNPAIHAMEGRKTGFVHRAVDPTHPDEGSLAQVNMTFVGEEAHDPIVHEIDPTTGFRNFYERWTPEGVTGVTGYKRLVMESVYDSVDYHITSNNSGPEFLIVVRPGGNPYDITMRFDGQDSLKVDVDGVLKTYLGDWMAGLPQGYVYQQLGTTIIDIPWLAIWDHEEGSVHVKLGLGEYDTTLPLIIVISPGGPPQAGGGGGAENYPPEWSTYAATPGGDAILGEDLDSNGNMYFTGSSTSNDVLPVTFGLSAYNAGVDLIVGRFNSNYEIEAPGTWMTYFGGSSAEVGEAIVYDGLHGRVIVGGKAEYSVDRPLVPLGSNTDCFQDTYGRCMLAFYDAANGQIQYFTRIHPSPLSKSYLNDVDIDAQGNAYFVGYSDIDGLSLVDPPGTIDYFADGTPELYGLYPYDAFVGKLTPQADLTWSFALGGPWQEYGYACHVDRERNKFYVVGVTETANDADTPDGSAGCEETEFPLVNGGGWYQYKLNGAGNEEWRYDGFITCFDLSNYAMLWSSYFGGAGIDDAITDVTTDLAGNIYITGFTNTAYFSSGDPCTWVNTQTGMPNCDTEGGYHQTAFGGGSYDNFIAKFDPDYALLAFTWVGGDLNEAHETPVTYHRARITNYHTVEQQGPIILFSHTPSGNEGSSAEPPLPMLANPLYYQQDWHHDAGYDTPEATDCYVGIFSTSLAPLAATYFGGKGSDYAGCVVSSSTRIYLGGRTLAPVFFPLGVPWMPPPLDPYFDWSSECTDLVHDGYLAQIQYDLVSVGLEGASTSRPPNALTLSPNPTSGTVRVDVPDVPGRLTITDAQGRQVANVQLWDRPARFDASQLAQGIFLLRYEWSGGTLAARLLKQ